MPKHYEMLGDELVDAKYAAMTSAEVVASMEATNHTPVGGRTATGNEVLALVDSATYIGFTPEQKAEFRWVTSLEQINLDGVEGAILESMLPDRLLDSLKTAKMISTTVKIGLGGWKLTPHRIDRAREGFRG